MILTYADGRLKTLYSEVWDTLYEYESAFTFELYFDPNSSTLFLFLSDGITEYYSEDFYAFRQDADGVFRKNALLRWEHHGAMDDDEEDEDIYLLNGSEITADEFEDLRREILTPDRITLIYGGMEDADMRARSRAMTYDEAIDWLSKQ